MKLINKEDYFLLQEVIYRNFASKYKGSVLGILWSVLKPLGIMIVLTIVFSTLFHGRIENYPVYILSGKCVFDFFSGSIGVSMNSIYGNRNILQKTAAPKFIFVIGSIISEFINFIITLVILVGVMIVTNATFYFTIIPFSIIPIASAFIMFTGIGLALSIVRVYYTDIQHLWGIITQMMFYASAIFYPMEIIPEPFHQFLILNPVFWIVDQFRAFGIYGTIPNIIYIINLILLSLIIFVFGMIIFSKYEKYVALKF